MITAPPDREQSPIDEFLDVLFGRLSQHPPRAARHLLAEVEAHLRDGAAEAVAHGTDPASAEGLAVERFGSIDELVAAESRRHATPLADLCRQVALTALLLGSLGALAVGASGAVAAIMARAGGSKFLVDVPRAGELKAPDCSRWLSAQSAFHSCAAAAHADWVTETIWYRIGLGLIGAVGLGAVMAFRRRLRARGRGRWRLLPDPATNTIAATIFVGAGLWLTGLGVDAALTSSGHGAGQWLSAGPVALAAGVMFGLRLIGDIRAANICA